MSRKGHYVGPASGDGRDGAAALACLARRSSGLLILDVMMPKMDGLELLRRLRKEAGIC